MWRINELQNGFIEIPDYDFESGKARIIGNLEDEVNHHNFIKVLENYKNIDEEIEQKIIELIEKSFQDYDKYENYSKYVWNAIKYFLKDLSNDLEYNIELINKITKLLTESTDINKNIEFKIILADISDKFLLKIERSEEIKKYKDKIKKLVKSKEKISKKVDKNNLTKINLELINKLKKVKSEKSKVEYNLRNEIKNKDFLNQKNIELNQKLNKYEEENIIIITEGPSDYYYLEKMYYELDKLGKIKQNSRNFLKHLKKIENNDNIGINYSNTESNKFCMYLAKNFKNKHIIGIFDTDAFPKDTFSKILKNKNEQEWVKGGYFETKLTNYHIIFLKSPKNLGDIYNNRCCIELLLGEKILKNNLLTKKYKNHLINKKEKKICGKPVYDIGKYYIDIDSKNSFIYEYNDINFYDKKTLEIINKESLITSFTSKIKFGENLNKLHNISKGIVLNFKHIFDIYSQIINKINKDELKK